MVKWFELSSLKKMIMIKKYLESKKKIIEQELLLFIKEQEQQSLALDYDTLRFLQDFIVSGKLHRGGLIFLGYDLFASKRAEDLNQDHPDSLLLNKLALVVELTHSALLLHDDVMDQDNFRRGKKTFNCLMSGMAQQKGVEGCSHFGDSLAICLGDLLLFWAGKIFTDALLTYSSTSKKCCQLLNDFFYQEMELTGWGQIDDVCLAARTDQVSTDLIYHVYSLKSGHYSIVNPLLLGAMVAGDDENSLELLKELALDLGVIFQIKDDHMNLFGDEAETGKPVGSDIKEDKKTIYRNLVVGEANSEDKKRLLEIFGNKQITQDEINFVQQMISKYQVDQEVNRMINDLLDNIQKKLIKIKLSPQANELLNALIQLMIKRRK